MTDKSDSGFLASIMLLCITSIVLVSIIEYGWIKLAKIEAEVEMQRISEQYDDFEIAPPVKREVMMMVP